MSTSQNQISSVEDYIKSSPLEIQPKLEELRKLIKEEIPGAQESISYKMPTFKLEGKYLIYFAAWKKHISIYPITTEMEKTIPGISEYKTSGKGTIQFPNNKPLPLPLIRKIVSFLLENRNANNS